MQIALYELEPWSDRRAWRVIINDENSNDKPWHSLPFEESDKVKIERLMHERIIDFLCEKHGEPKWREIWSVERHRLNETCTVHERTPPSQVRGLAERQPLT